MRDIYTFKKVDINNIEEIRFNAFKYKTVYCTKEWIKYIESTHQNTKIIVLEIYRNNDFIGYFTGGIITVFGFIKILGSPFNGWNTPFMGFDLYDERLITELIPLVVKYFFKYYKCIYIQICNEYLSEEELLRAHINFDKSDDAFQTDLTVGEEEIFSKFTKGTKANIKKFERLGGKIVEDYSDEFVSAYWEQLLEVFGKQELLPPHDDENIKKMINALETSEKILCIKALNPDGVCIATLIQVGFGYLCVTIGCPSFLEYQKEYRPNEALMWYAIKYWKNKGAKIFEYGGGGEYKKKYGGIRLNYCIVTYSKIPGLKFMKETANKIYWIINSIKMKLKLEESDGERNSMAER